MAALTSRTYVCDATFHTSRYVDMTAGIAVNALGHSDPRWLATLTEQAGKLSHTSNLYHTKAQVGGGGGGGAQ